MDTIRLRRAARDALNARLAASTKHFFGPVWTNKQSGASGHPRYTRLIAGTPNMIWRLPHVCVCPMGRTYQRHSVINGGRSALSNDCTGSSSSRKHVSSVLHLLDTARKPKAPPLMPTALHAYLSWRINPLPPLRFHLAALQKP
jgi:hypothetical protein